MNDTRRKYLAWVLNQNVLFVVIAAAAFFLWPESWVREQPRSVPRAETSTVVLQEGFDADVLADAQSGWSRLWTEDTQLVRVADGVLRIQFSSNRPLGAVYVLDRYEPNRIYEIRAKLRQVRTCGALIVRVRKKGRTSVRQIAGRCLLPTEGEGPADVATEFVAPNEAGREVLIQFYPYDALRDRGGEMIIDRMDILKW